MLKTVEKFILGDDTATLSVLKASRGGVLVPRFAFQGALVAEALTVNCAVHKFVALQKVLI